MEGNNSLSLKLLYEQLKESLDFNNIKPLEWHNLYFNKYNAKTKDGINIDIYFQTNYTSKELESLGLSEINPKNLYNVLYTLDGVETQLKKEDYGYLIQVIKTIMEVCLDFIKKEKVEGLLFFAANKLANKYHSQTDPQKSKLYKLIAVKELSSKLNGWDIKDIELDKNYGGFLIYKK